MEELYSILIPNFVSGYKNDPEQYQIFGTTWINTLLNEHNYPVIVQILEQSQFKIDDELMFQLLETGELSILEYLSTHNYPLFEKKRVPRLTMENISWLLQIANPNKLYKIALKQYQLDVLHYLAQNCILNKIYLDIIILWGEVGIRTNLITTDDYISILKEAPLDPISNEHIIICRMAGLVISANLLESK